jgi:hypothetical protein
MDWETKNMTEFLRNCSEALCLEARYAVEQGDIAESLESIKAAGNLARALSNTRNPTLKCVFSGSVMMARARDVTFQSILPKIPSDQLDLPAWESALFSTLKTPTQFADCMRAEWTHLMLKYILTTFADPAEENQPPDPDHLVEAYTRYVSNMVKGHAPLALADLPSHPWIPMDTTGLSWRSQRLCSLIGSYNYRINWERTQQRTGLTKAAFAVLKGQLPPNDPIYGKPYSWNPVTREISMPDSPEFRYYNPKPIKLPKL